MTDNCYYGLKNGRVVQARQRDKDGLWWFASLHADWCISSYQHYASSHGKGIASCPRSLMVDILLGLSWDLRGDFKLTDWQ
jgi:hypothetical protein